MRFLFLLFIVLTGCRSNYQPHGYIRSNTTKYPFQVVKSNSCVDLVTNEPMSELALVRKDSRLSLTDGHIIMIYYSGKFFEFEGDTTFNISDINLIARKNIKDPKIRFRPEPTFLFAINYIAASGPIRAPIILFSDVTRDVQEHDSKLCLEWINNSSNREIEKYLVSIKDIYEQDVDQLITNNKRITLDFSNYTAEHQLYLVSVYDSANLNIKSNEVGVKKGMSSFFVPNSCNVVSAIDALEYAFHLERMSFLGEHLMPYFKLATELSDQIIYKELLGEYKQRMPKYY